MIEDSEEKTSLWEAAAALFGEPRTPTEKSRRVAEVAELKKAGVRPAALAPLVAKWVKRYRGGVRPSLKTIVANLGDLYDGFDVDQAAVERALEEDKERAEREARLDGLREVEKRAKREVEGGEKP